jgi:HSP20 family protein
MSIVKFKPSHVPTNFTHFFDNYFGRDVADFIGRDQHATVPAVNVAETSEGYRVEVAAPGLLKEKFNVSVNNNVLTISYKQEESTEEKQEKFTRREFFYTNFQRSFTLPNTVESERIEAKYSDGVLHILVPKREEAKVKPSRTIEIA